MIKDFELTEEMQDAYQAIKNGNSVIILGTAGSGKSTFINYLVDSGLKIIKVAPTGVSSSNIGGTTVHKFFGIPPRIVEAHKMKQLPWEKAQMLSACDAILIDEISMVRSDVMDGIDQVLKLTMKNGHPFGGIPLIMMGDLGQLPPVVASQAEKDYFRFKYKSEFFFDSEVFNTLDEENLLTTINFTKVFRQKDSAFIDILNTIRFGTITHEQLEELNKKCYLNKTGKEIKLCGRNDEVQRVNDNELFENDNPLEEYLGEIDGEFKIENCVADYRVSLKIGSRVMILLNNPEQGFHNGSMGVYLGTTTTEDGEKLLRVELDSSINDEKKIVEIAKHKFVEVEQKYSRENHTIEENTKGSMTQYPIKLAFALTVHKTQGLTFDNMSLDVGRGGAFSHGQVYVALSRCRTIEGLNLTRRLQKSDIIIDKRVKEWLERYNMIM